jgi:hypothetical protein
MIQSDFELRRQQQHRRKMLALGGAGALSILSIAAIVDIHLMVFLLAMGGAVAGGSAILYATFHWDDKNPR